MLALDPGTHTGFATPDRHGTFDLTPLHAMKGKPGRPAKISKRDGRIISPEVPPIPGRIAEPEFARCGKLYTLLDTNFGSMPSGEPVVVEGAASFQRGKAAVRVSHELRGVVKAWCHRAGFIYVEIQPHDLKRFVTGRGDADKNMMIARARELYGYEGDDDDEADAIHLLHWGLTHLKATESQSPQTSSQGGAQLSLSGVAC